jgi:hypothetical protein
MWQKNIPALGKASLLQSVMMGGKLKLIAYKILCRKRVICLQMVLGGYPLNF